MCSKTPAISSGASGIRSIMTESADQKLSGLASAAQSAQDMSVSGSAKNESLPLSSATLTSRIGKARTNTVLSG